MPTARPGVRWIGPRLRRIPHLTMTGRRILVAMSGGVDSSVAAALLREAGHEPIGVTLHLWDAHASEMVGRCCAPEDREDARIACEHLGIPHYVFDEREAFLREVVEPFVEEHRDGRTPSPCATCNRLVKLDRLLAIADRLGCVEIATGHYIRIAESPEGRRLLRGADRSKDQSYFLYGLRPAVLNRLVAPLGNHDKSWTREQGRRLGIESWQKKDSQELCFIPDGDTEGFLRGRGVAFEPGEIVDEGGEVLAVHEGLARYTVGQRRGLGLGGGPPRYVLRRLPTLNQIVVGGEKSLMQREARVVDARWIREPAAEPFEAAVRIRHRHEPAPALVRQFEGGFRVEFLEPQRAVTPGQAAVVYVGDEVLGGGVIA